MRAVLVLRQSFSAAGSTTKQNNDSTYPMVWKRTVGNYLLDYWRASKSYNWSVCWRQNLVRKEICVDECPNVSPYKSRHREYRKRCKTITKECTSAIGSLEKLKKSFRQSIEWTTGAGAHISPEICRHLVVIIASVGGNHKRCWYRVFECFGEHHDG